MATGYRYTDFDFDDLFDPDVIGDGPSVPSMRANGNPGTPLKFAALIYGTKRPDVGYRTPAGVDVSNLWAAKGTSSSVTDGGLPAFLTRTVTVSVPGSVSSVVSFTFAQNGTITWSSGSGAGSGTWVPGGGTVGDGYDVEFTQVSSTGAGVLVGVGSGWQQVNASRLVSLTATLPPSGLATIEGTRVVRLRIRDRATNTVRVDRTIELAVLAERVG